MESVAISGGNRTVATEERIIFSGNYLKEDYYTFEKYGNPEDAYKTVCTLLHHINVTDIHPLVGSFETNNISAVDDEKAINEINDIVDFLK